MLISSRNIRAETLRIVSSNIWALCDPVKMTHKINYHKCIDYTFLLLFCFKLHRAPSTFPPSPVHKIMFKANSGLCSVSIGEWELLHWRKEHLSPNYLSLITKYRIRLFRPFFLSLQILTDWSIKNTPSKCNSFITTAVHHPSIPLSSF